MTINTQQDTYIYDLDMCKLLSTPSLFRAKIKEYKDHTGSENLKKNEFCEFVVNSFEKITTEKASNLAKEQKREVNMLQDKTALAILKLYLDDIEVFRNTLNELSEKYNIARKDMLNIIIAIYEDNPDTFDADMLNSKWILRYLKEEVDNGK